MTSIIKISGTDVAIRPSKKAGHALIAATLGELHGPLQVASQCSREMRGYFRHVNETDPHRGCLPNAKFNHPRMLARVALVNATRDALLSIIRPRSAWFPDRAPPISRADATMMLSVLFGSVGKSKTTDSATLLGACVDMFAPGSDEIGEATGMWRPISRHPIILALAVKKLTYNSVFTSVAELRVAMQQAHGTVTGLARDVERWLDLLRSSDRCVFEHDREAWLLAYQNVGADVVRAMQDPDEADDGDEPATARWMALEELRLAKLQD